MSWVWSHLALVGAMADPAELSLRWEAPPPCPDETQLRREVGELLREATRGDATFDARVRREEELFRLELTTRWSDGREDERTLRAPSCEELADAAVLLIAMTLDPVAATGHVHDRGWPAETEDSAPADPPAAKQPPRRVKRTVPRPRPNALPVPARPIVYGVRPQMLADWGSLPKLAPGPALNLSLTWKLLRVELGAVYLPRQRATRSDVSKAGAWVELGAVSPRACVTPVANSVSFPVCAGVELGATRARGIGTELASSTHAFWAAATGGPTLIWSMIPRLAIALGLDIVVPITRTRVRTTSLETLHTPESVVLRPLLGLEVRL